MTWTWMRTYQQRLLCVLQDMYTGSPGQKYSTPVRHSAIAFDQAAAARMDALSAISAPASVLETAGKQDEVSRAQSFQGKSV